MECSVACQRRHSGWTEWSNRGTRRREEKRTRKNDRTMCPFCSITSPRYIPLTIWTWINFQINKLCIKQTHANRTWDTSSNHIHTQTQDLSTWRSLKTIITVCVIEPNPLYISHYHTAPPLYTLRNTHHAHFNIFSKSPRYTLVWMHQLFTYTRLNQLLTPSLIREKKHKEYSYYDQIKSQDPQSGSVEVAQLQL